MSRLSAVWAAAALSIVFVLLLGAVVLRPALSDPAQAAETVQVDATGGGYGVDDGIELSWDDDDDDHEHDDEDDRDDSHGENEDGEDDDEHDDD